MSVRARRRALALAARLFGATLALAARPVGATPALVLAVVGVCLFVSGAHAATPAGPPPALPRDGAVAFRYVKDAAVVGCSQRTEPEIRDLVRGVVHGDPFVAAGEPAPFLVQVTVNRSPAGAVRAEFSLLDDKGASLGTSAVEDPTCDGAHLKLAASIALLVQPRQGSSPPVCPPCPEPGCDPACRTAVRIALQDEVKKQVRAEELPKIRDEARKDAERAHPISDWRAVISAGPVLGLELAADPAPGFWLSGEARSERWSFGLEARALFPTRAYVLGDGSTIDVGSVSGLFVPCVRFRWLSGCGLAELGSVWVGGPGAAGDPKGLLFGLGARARLDVPLVFGFEARVFGDFMGHLLGITVHGTDTAGNGGAPFTVDAPRRVSAFLGIGLGRSF